MQLIEVGGLEDELEWSIQLKEWTRLPSQLHMGKKGSLGVKKAGGATP